MGRSGCDLVLGRGGIGCHHNPSLLFTPIGSDFTVRIVFGFRKKFIVSTSLSVVTVLAVNPRSVRLKSKTLSSVCEKM